MYLIEILAIVAVLAFNLAVSRHVYRDRRRTNQETVAEIGLTWCVPIFGGLIALAISGDDPRRVRKSKGLLAGAAAAAASTNNA